MKRKAARFAIDSVVVNGDLIEGRQPKQKASELTLIAPNERLLKGGLGPSDPGL